MAKSKEQLRAEHVWAKVSANGGCPADYVKLVKGLPALIMNSGLLQVLAFLQEKSQNNPPHSRLLSELREWLGLQWPDLKSDDFGRFMRSLMAMPSGDYQRVTSEAFSWLRWTRQFAAASQANRKNTP